MTDLGKPMKYKRSIDRRGNKMRVTITSSSGVTATSSWWRVDDGSAEQEACKRLAKAERAHNAEVCND